ncbi:MAG: hypothetical protein NZ739_12110 [Verrucomicrobiae bacterium]|nr:hypothetical protein [Verrucomicrobiae bacterium]
MNNPIPIPRGRARVAQSWRALLRILLDCSTYKHGLKPCKVKYNKTVIVFHPYLAKLPPTTAYRVFVRYDENEYCSPTTELDWGKLYPGKVLKPKRGHGPLAVWTTWWAALGYAVKYVLFNHTVEIWTVDFTPWTKRLALDKYGHPLLAWSRSKYDKSVYGVHVLDLHVDCNIAEQVTLRQRICTLTVAPNKSYTA